MANDLTNKPECKNAQPPQNIVFNNEFFESIRSGRKIATTRKGIRCFKAGQIVSALDNEKNEVLKLTIKEVLEKTFYTLDEKTARAEDATLEELQIGLVEIYGEEIKNSPLSVIYFQLLD